MCHFVTLLNIIFIMLDFRYVYIIIIVVVVINNNNVFKCGIY